MIGEREDKLLQRVLPKKEDSRKMFQFFEGLVAHNCRQPRPWAVASMMWVIYLLHHQAYAGCAELTQIYVFLMAACDAGYMESSSSFQNKSAHTQKSVKESYIRSNDWMKWRE